MKIKIKYNGRRYPRAIIMRNGSRASFLERRTELDLDEYDALYLLKGNSRLKPSQWEFTVMGIIENDPKPEPIVVEPITEPVNIPPINVTVDEKKYVPEKKKVKKAKKKSVQKMAT